MNIGLLWYDPDPKAELPAKIERAANYYEKKYGKRPNQCYVHPKMIPAGKPDEKPEPTGFDIRSSRSILPNHLWIGCAETASA
jgi:hypothetical protein